MFKKFAFLIPCLAMADLAGAATQHVAKVATVHSPDSRACAFFRLTGVNQADPINPNVPWFAVPISHPGYDTIMTLLVSARITDRPVLVRTTSSTACGHVTVNNIEF